MKCSLHHCTYENIFLYGWLRLSKNSWAYSLKLTDYIFPVWWLVSSQRNGASQTFIILAHTYSQAGRGGRENDVWSTRHAWPFPLLSGQKSITNSPPLNSFRWVVLKYSCLPIRGHLSLLRSSRQFLIIVQLSYCVKFRLFENFEIFENCLSHLRCARIVSQILLLIIHDLNESCSSTLACLSDICSPFGYRLALLC